MWKLKIAEGKGPYLYSTNNFVGRQIWEYDPNGGTLGEREALDRAREEYINNRKKGVCACSDMFMRMQLIQESGLDLLSTPPVRLADNEDVTFEATTTAVKKALRLNRAIQASDGHWPAEHTGPMFYTPPLVIETMRDLRGSLTRPHHIYFFLFTILICFSIVFTSTNVPWAMFT